MKGRKKIFHAKVTRREQSYTKIKQNTLNFKRLSETDKDIYSNKKFNTARCNN